MTMKKIMNSIFALVRRFCTRELIIYGIAGVLATVLSIVVYTAAVSHGFSVGSSNTISTVVAVLFAYVTNKIWVFETHDYRPHIIVWEMLAFFAARFLTYALETGALILLVNILGFPNLYTKIATSTVVIILNYFISKKAVFRKS